MIFEANIGLFTPLDLFDIFSYFSDYIQHQSQSSTFLYPFHWQSDKKNTDSNSEHGQSVNH